VEWPVANDTSDFLYTVAPAKHDEPGDNTIVDRLNLFQKLIGLCQSLYQ
jgi:hypothetical protein